MDGIISTAERVALLTPAQLVNIVVFGVVIVVVLIVISIYKRTNANGTVDVKNIETIHAEAIQSHKREDRQTTIIEQMVRQSQEMIEHNRTVDESNRRTMEAALALLNVSVVGMTDTMDKLGKITKEVRLDVADAKVETITTRTLMQEIRAENAARFTAMDAIADRVVRVEVRTENLENRLTELKKDTPLNA